MSRLKINLKKIIHTFRLRRKLFWCKERGGKRTDSSERKIYRFEQGAKLRSSRVLVSFQPTDPGLLNTRAIYKTQTTSSQSSSSPSTLLPFRSNDLDIHPRIPIFLSRKEGERKRKNFIETLFLHLRIQLMSC